MKTAELTPHAKQDAEGATFDAPKIAHAIKGFDSCHCEKRSDDLSAEALAKEEAIHLDSSRMAEKPAQRLGEGSRRFSP